MKTTERNGQRKIIVIVSIALLFILLIHVRSVNAEMTFVEGEFEIDEAFVFLSSSVGDLRAPVLTLDQNQTLVRLDREGININWTAVDDINLTGTNFNVTYSNGTEIFVSTASSGEVNLSSPTELPINDTYIINLWATDDNFNEAYLSSTFEVGNFSPNYYNLTATPPSNSQLALLGVNYVFNATWTDHNAVDNVFIVFDGNNYTMQEGNVTVLDGVYSFNISNLIVGDHTYMWFANNSYDDENQTGILTYIVRSTTNDWEIAVIIGLLSTTVLLIVIGSRLNEEYRPLRTLLYSFSAFPIFTMLGFGLWDSNIDAGIASTMNTIFSASIYVFVFFEAMLFFSVVVSLAKGIKEKIKNAKR